MSVDEFQLSVMVVPVEATFARFGGVDGGVVSTIGHPAVEAFSDARDERLPAASTASTANVYAVPQVNPGTVNDALGDVPTSVVPL